MERKEAIEVVKKNWPDSSFTMLREALETLIPELKESEDEKIIDAIKYGLKCLGWEHVDGIKISDMNAWLERQSEHANFRNKIQVGDKVTRNEAGVLVNLSQLKRIAKPVEEYNITGIGSKHAQGKLGEMIKKLKPVNEVLEQDSANKVEPIFNVGDKIQYLKGCGTIMTIEKIEDGEYIFANNMGHTTIENGNKWHLVEQNPAWSEEDEKMLNDILMCGEHHCYLDAGNITWLKSIKDKVQPQQKQEWSEEDSPYYDDICEILINLLRSETANVNKTAVQKDLDWLNSLRPQNTWKPSDEQMDAIDYVKNFDYGGYKDMLVSLYYDLKKLKDE